MGVLREFGINIWAGAKLAVLAPVKRDSFREGHDQAVLLLFAYFSLNLLAVFLTSGTLLDVHGGLSPAGGFDPESGLRHVIDGLAQSTSLYRGVLCLLLAGYIVARVSGRPDRFGPLVIAITSATLTALFVTEIARFIYGYQALFSDKVGVFILWMHFTWLGGIFYRGTMVAMDRKFALGVGAIGVFALVYLGPMYWMSWFHGSLVRFLTSG